MNVYILFGLAVLCYFVFVNKSIFSFIKPYIYRDKYRVVTNGKKFRIQQNLLFAFWQDYYGFGDIRGYGKIDVTLQTKEEAFEIIRLLHAAAQARKDSKQWRVIEE